MGCIGRRAYDTEKVFDPWEYSSYDYGDYFCPIKIRNMCKEEVFEEYHKLAKLLRDAEECYNGLLKQLDDIK